MTTARSTHDAALDVHRLLDEAFAGAEMSPERQDLKEEIRANLVARVGELVDTGLHPATAARQAMTELGDLGPLLDAAPAGDGGSPAPEWARHRVRPAPGFLVRTAFLATLGVAGLVLVALAATGTAVPSGWLLVAVAAVAVGAGAGTADALRQETSTSYPMPTPRAAGYGLAVALGLAALGAGWHYLTSDALPWLLGGALAVVASVVLFTYLGGTQTNRHKPWVLRIEATHRDGVDRFTQDPAAAARFGLYTATTWLIAIAAFVVLGVTVGWVWSWLALLAGTAAMLVMLARMQFGQRHPA
ncbi:permease prefix domain 1-containing protein [Micromonospora sp. WMMD1082]|uniref:permease prefix domain 1-containing protein n=1 Tax=Micromonospora sp. WMMD1082 TaxID=3016104 RepID=UPI0024170BE8|nr:permease prefix domain 1-containing protein [Micromonospora sp. WMMD1082]MDG4798202.1 permease prefix domain 1-containing protein [Micromonospora sp. WMMD1082]